jgi:hypothetical protein
VASAHSSQVVRSAPNVRSSQVAEEATSILCPKCSSPRTHRMERQGFMQQKIYPFFGYFPWECKICRVTFLEKKRNKRKKSSSQERGAD